MWASAALAALALAAPSVQTMIVGRSATLLSATTIRAQAATVQVGGRRCAVGAGTALAALAAARRAGGPSFRLRDYGRCGSAPADSGQLFVYRIGPDRNGGQDGWVYKVGHRSASNGSADLAGAFGDGRRLRSGARVLWFWCVMSRGGCQRTLEVAPSARSVSPGAPLSVQVSGYDDNGHGVPIAGATVTLAGASATTAPGGVATLTAPATAGTYAVTAQAAGTVPAFPEQVGVR